MSDDIKERLQVGTTDFEEFKRMRVDALARIEALEDQVVCADDLIAKLNGRVRELLGKNEALEAKECYHEEGCPHWVGKSIENHKLKAQLAGAREALEELEQANEDLASTRPRAAYDAMIDGGQEDQLLTLDQARAKARAALGKATQ